MELYEIRNDEWEEIIMYYCSSKRLYDKNRFLEIIKNKEKIEFDLTKSRIISSNKIFEEDEFLMKKLQNDLDEAMVYLLNDEWDCKIILIETNECYILKLWSTSA